MQNRLSVTYRILKRCGLNLPEEEYGNINLWYASLRMLKIFYHSLMQNMMDWSIYAPIAAKIVRPILLRQMGATVGRGVYIGDHVVFDLNRSNLLIIEDHAHLDTGCIVFCHKRNLENYFVGDDYAKLPYREANVILKQGCSVGSGSILLPGVTIGEGAIVGAGSLVTKDIPAWTVAVGRPAKVMREIPKKED